MYNEYDYLDELLEEAYLEGYYDGYEDDYYIERRTVNTAYGTASRLYNSDKYMAMLNQYQKKWEARHPNATDSEKRAALDTYEKLLKNKKDSNMKVFYRDRKYIVNKEKNKALAKNPNQDVGELEDHFDIETGKKSLRQLPNQNNYRVFNPEGNIPGKNGTPWGNGYRININRDLLNKNRLTMSKKERQEFNKSYITKSVSMAKKKNEKEIRDSNYDLNTKQALQAELAAINKEKEERRAEVEAEARANRRGKLKVNSSRSGSFRTKKFKGSNVNTATVVPGNTTNVTAPVKASATPSSTPTNNGASAQKGFSKKAKIGVGVGAGAVLGGGIGYGIYRHNKKKKEILEELKDPRFRRQHPELVKKYRKALIKQGIKVEAAGYYYDDYDNFDIIDTDYYEVY